MLRIALFATALAAGGGAAWLALAVQPGNVATTDTAEVAPQLPMTQILVAAADIGQGQKLQEANVRWQSWPADAVNEGFVDRAQHPEGHEELYGAIIRNQVVAGEPILAGKLVKSDSGFLAAILPSGMRAVAVRVTAENTAGGFILPNDRVDLLHTVTGEADGSFSRTILRNVRVLAIDQMAEGDGTDAAAIGKTATLELAPEQAETVAAAEASGVLSLALRSVADADEIEQEEPVARKSAGSVRFIRAGRTEVESTNRALMKSTGSGG